MNMDDKLRRYTQENTSFHMPGHKSGKIKTLEDFYEIDVTEVEGTDNLYHPQGIIRDAQDEIAQVYGAKASFLLVNGSTGGILAGVFAAMKSLHTKNLVMARNCHKAVYNAAYLERIEPIFVMPKFQEEYGFYIEIEAEEIERVLKKLGEAAVVVVTSPTYEGIVSDIDRIAQVVHDHGGILIVDEAHGAHFTYSERLPKSALSQGADLVIHSAHKTLPALTQTGILHLGSDRIASEDLLHYLSLFQTSSPSYVLMASTLQGVRYMDQHRKEYDQYLEGIENLMKGSMEGGFWLHDKYCSGTSDSRRQDLTRLVFLSNRYSGYELNRRLRLEYQIQVEMSGLGHLVAISTFADRIMDIEALIRGINAINQEMIAEGDAVGEARRKNNFRWKSNSQLMIEHPRTVNMYEAGHREGEIVPLGQAIGEVSKQFVIPYPPGIPLLIPGETVTDEKISLLHELIHEKCEIYGIIEGEHIEIISRRLEQA